MCAGGAGVSLRPPSEAVLDDLLRQHIHLARQSIDCTRAMAGRIEASLNTNHRYTTLQDTQKASQSPTPTHYVRHMPSHCIAQKKLRNNYAYQTLLC